MSAPPSIPFRPGWRHRLVAGYYRAREHPARLRLLHWVKQLLFVDRVRVEVFPGVVMELDDADYVNRKILFDGSYELATLRLFDRLLSSARGFIDIGAHHGQYTLRAARILGPRHGRVIAFEPTPSNAARLLHNARLSALTNFDLYCFALSDAGGVLRMIQPFANNTGGAHLAAEGAADDDSAVRLHVAVRPFADVAHHIPEAALDLVKVDVEGHEKRVLSALFASPVRKPRHLILEYFTEFFDYGAPEGLPAWLAAQGYEVHTVEGEPYRTGDPLPDNNLWAQYRE